MSGLSVAGAPKSATITSACVPFNGKKEESIDRLIAIEKASRLDFKDTVERFEKRAGVVVELLPFGQQLGLRSILAR